MKWFIVVIDGINQLIYLDFKLVLFEDKFFYNDEDPHCKDHPAKERFEFLRFDSFGKGNPD